MMTRDNSPLSGGISGALAPSAPSGGRTDARAELREVRIREHRYRHRADERRRKGAIDQASRQRRADHDEAELTARAEQERRFGGSPGRQTEARVPERRAPRPWPPTSAAASPRMRPGRARMNAGLISAPTETK